jgi:hypothetical protein
MVWSGIWSYQVDGTELNDNVDYVAFVPEIENLQPRNIILADRDGDYPVFIRSQPASGSYTFLIAMKNAGTETLWNARITALRALFDQTTYHTLSVQARGMPERLEVQFITEGLQGDFKTRTVVVNAVAPNPNLVAP